MNRRSAAPVVVSLLLISAGALLVVYTRLDTGVAPPKEDFTCENGHRWSAEVSAAPRCPTCGLPAISRSRYRCNKCSHEFVGLEVKKLGSGEFRYRVPHTTAWAAEPPQELTCPNCGSRGDITVQFRGLGYAGQPPGVQVETHR